MAGGHPRVRAQGERIHFDFFGAAFLGRGLATAFFAGDLAAGFAAAFASGAFAAGASLTGLAGLGLAEAFSTRPLAGASGSGLASALAFAPFFAFAGLAAAKWSCPQPGPWTWPSSLSRSASSSARVA